MEPDPRFVHQPMDFWAHVRTLSQSIGYAEKGTGLVKTPTLAACLDALRRLQLRTDHFVDGEGDPTAFGDLVLAYFDFRASVLNRRAKRDLMNADEARAEFERLKSQLRPRCPLPMNKQKGDKRAPAYFTCIVNMVIEANAGGVPCNYDPQELTTVTRHGVPVRTLARRVDGAFPSPVNPVAIWEIKEYYYTTTFGSRVADGVYESLLDGMELEELRSGENIDVKHYLMVDARDNWWNQGKPYLCRIVDMLHMGYVDEVLFGREVLVRLPPLVRGWVKLAKAQAEPTPEVA